MRRAGLPARFVFISPPSMEELEKRLRGRGTETEDKILKRLAGAQAEMDARNESGLFDHQLVNLVVENTFTGDSASIAITLTFCAAHFPPQAGKVPVERRHPPCCPQRPAPKDTQCTAPKGHLLPPVPPPPNEAPAPNPTYSGPAPKGTYAHIRKACTSTHTRGPPPTEPKPTHTHRRP